jgi:predicted nucleic acid-binding protein
MPKIFIDTNIFLDFYRAKKDSLGILRELYQHSGSIVFPSLVYDEFLRNRVKIIEQVINSLRNEKPKYFTSAIVEGLEVFEDLKKSRDEHRKYLDITISKLEEIKEDSKQDDVFLELSKLYKSEKIEIYEHDDSIIHKAQRRHLLGQPPGTDKVKICDEVIWETILARIDDDIIIVSRDGTYKENHQYLSHEYEEKTDKKLLKITDKISEGIKLLGETVPPEIIELEGKQIDALTREKFLDDLLDAEWIGFSSSIKAKSGGWDPDLSKYEWLEGYSGFLPSERSERLFERIKEEIKKDWLKKTDRKEALKKTI